MAEKFNIADFLHKNSLFFGSVIFLTLFYCKKFVASRESLKWRLSSRLRRRWLYFHPIFSKIIFLSSFFLFLFILGKSRTFKEKLFVKWIYIICHDINEVMYQRVGRP
jgi:hypothetical protein